MPKTVDWFVNRTTQYNFFWEKMVVRTTPVQILLVEAPTQMGKTWLLQRLFYECSTKKMPVALFNFRDRRAWDYLALVRQARDQIGEASFNALTQAINAATSVTLQLPTSNAGNVTIKLATDSGQVSDSDVKVGDVAGGNIVKDNNFFIQNDNPIIRQAIEARITSAFIDCLKDLTQNQITVLLFDSYEELNANVDMVQWLQASLFARICEGKLPKTIIVIAGQKTPQFDDAWSDYKIFTRLTPFDQEYVADYLKRRGLGNLDLNTIFAVSQGMPGTLAMLADNATAKKDGEL